MPNDLSDAIDERITVALKGRWISDDEYDAHYNAILEYFDMNGRLPEIQFEKLGGAE